MVAINWTEDFHELGKAIGRRIKERHGFSRSGNICVEDAIEVPEGNEFFELIREKVVENGNTANTRNDIGDVNYD